MKNFNKICRLAFIIILLVVSSIIDAQTNDSTLVNDTTLTLDVLTSPISPGSMILGVNPSEIQKPSDLTGVWTSFRNSTNNFTEFPTSFAIDIAPKWVFNRKSITFEDFAGKKKSFSQTLNLSYSQVSQNDSNYNGLKQGIGVSFYIIRPAITDKQYLENISSIRSIQRILSDATTNRLKELRKMDRAYDSLETELKNSQTEERAKVITNLLEKMDKIFNTEVKKYVDSTKDEQVAKLKQFEKGIIPVRKGFFLNVSAGTLVRYDQFKVNHSSLANKSAWINFGYDGINIDSSGKSYFSFLALSRVIADNKDELFKSGINNSYTTWDNGLRIGYTTNDQRFTFSLEAIARKLFNTDIGNNFVYKYLVNLELHVGKNQKLTFSYGKDFQNHITKDGNVVGYINFITGFLNQKKLK